MDKLTTYRDLVKKHLNTIADLINRQPTAGVQAECVFDEVRDHYLLVKNGWTPRGRVRATTVYVRLRDGKIWVEEDWTEDGVATDLVRAGVPKEDIVLAFHPPDVRKQTEFAVT